MNDLTNRLLDYTMWEMSKPSLNGLTFDPVAAEKNLKVVTEKQV